MPFEHILFIRYNDQVLLMSDTEMVDIYIYNFFELKESVLYVYVFVGIILTILHN